MSSAELSVIIPSVNGFADLGGCLTALEEERASVILEVIVVDRCGPVVRNEVARLFPAVRVLAAESGTPIPQLRALGCQAATGTRVAIIEDHVIVPRGWSRALCDASRETGGVVGGSVDNGATEQLTDWAAFLCEYSHCLPPLPAGPTTWLTGNNVIYPRQLLERYHDVIAAGRWENHLHEALLRDGIQLVCRPEICVSHKKHYSVGEYLTQRFLYARSYAGTRLVNASVAKRVAFGFAAFALPPLLFYRTVSRVLKKKRYRLRLLQSLPLLALFVGSWSVGEVVGYWSGPADSLAKVT